MIFSHYVKKIEVKNLYSYSIFAFSGKVGTFGCHGQGGNQFFEMNSKNELRYTSQFELCIAKKERVKISLNLFGYRFIPLRFRKSGSVWYGGPEETG